MHEEALIHGTCIALDGEGVLLVGKPGSGKSDLALRLIDQPGSGLSGIPKTAQLVADDQVIIRKVEALDDIGRHDEIVVEEVVRLG